MRKPALPGGLCELATGLTASVWRTLHPSKLVRRRLICKGKLPFSLSGEACPSRSIPQEDHDAEEIWGAAGQL
jgi:hypothetical protein